MNQLQAAINAKTGVIWVKSQEELRVTTIISGMLQQMSNPYRFFTWSVIEGLCSKDYFGGDDTRDLNVALKLFFERKNERSFLLVLAGASWLNDPQTLRKVIECHREIKSFSIANAKQLVFLDMADAPSSLPGLIIIDWPLPDRRVMTELMRGFVKGSTKIVQDDMTKNGNMDEVVGSLLGLTWNDAENALAMSVATTGKISLELVSIEKKRIVKGSGLEWHDPDPRGMDGIGGNENLKSWLKNRRKAFSSAAREFGLPTPKGCLIFGVPGAGKSLTAKCIAAAWKMPLLRLDVGALFSKYVGESESQLRKALQTAETIAPAIIWVDEIEKAFGSSAGESDGGTSNRVLGTFLTWMQERKGVFVVATSNDISKLPPEFLRAGRWDDLWFVDLPNFTERMAICEVMKKKFKHCTEVDSKRVAQEANNHTGAEIEQAFADALYEVFNDELSDVSTKHVLEALKERVPLAVAMPEKIAQLREKAKGRARTASAPEQAENKPKSRAVERA